MGWVGADDTVTDLEASLWVGDLAVASREQLRPLWRRLTSRAVLGPRIGDTGTEGAAFAATLAVRLHTGGALRCPTRPSTRRTGPGLSDNEAWRPDMPMYGHLAWRHCRLIPRSSIAPVHLACRDPDLACVRFGLGTA
jgi:hypothetical protein